MMTILCAGFAFLASQSRTPKAPSNWHQLGDKYDCSFVGKLTAADRKRVDEEDDRTADLTARYKDGNVKEVYLLGREYLSEYQKEKPICLNTLVNWGTFGRLFAVSALHFGHEAEALRAFVWMKPFGGDDYDMTAALTSLKELSHGSLAEAQTELKNLKSPIVPPAEQLSGPEMITKQGVLANSYLIISRFGENYDDYGLMARYDAMAVRNAPTCEFCYLQEAHALGMLQQYDEAISVLKSVAKQLSGSELQKVNKLEYGYSQLQEASQQQKLHRPKVKTGAAKP